MHVHDSARPHPCARLHLLRPVKWADLARSTIAKLGQDLLRSSIPNLTWTDYRYELDLAIVFFLSWDYDSMNRLVLKNFKLSYKRDTTIHTARLLPAPFSF